MNKTVGKVRKAPAEVAEGRCLCGRVRIEIGVPARWAWHDHSKDSRLAPLAPPTPPMSALLAQPGPHRQGRDRPHPLHRGGHRADPQLLPPCGTPVLYERPHAAQMVNIPRALFETRTGREPLYHIAIEQAREWTWRGEKLRPLKGFPGVVWTGPKKKRRPLMDEEFKRRRAGTRRRPPPGPPPPPPAPTRSF